MNRPGSVQPLRPPVPQVRDTGPRPFWSVMIPTYHCARYLAQTLRSVLDQDPGEDTMEIVVVDDHSVLDDPEAVVRRVAGERVRFVRREHNGGHVATFNTCLTVARGRWVHILHGDDWVLPGFYAAARAVASGHPEVGAVICRYQRWDEATARMHAASPLQDEAGVLTDWAERLGARQRLQAPSIVVRRDIYESVGGFDTGLRGYGEDWEMWLRVAVATSVWWHPEALAVYRVRPGSLSDRTRLRSNVADMRRVIALTSMTLADHLPPKRIASTQREARRSFALALVRRARRALADGDRRAPWDVLREAILLWPRGDTAAAGLRLVVKWAYAVLGHGARGGDARTQV